MSIALRQQTRLWKKKANTGKYFQDYYIIYLILFYSFNAMLNFLQKHLVVCNSRLILGTIAVSESVTLTQWACEKWHDIKPHNNYSFQGKRISHFLWIKLPSPRLHVYTPYLAPSFLLNKTIKYSMSNKINTRFSEYTNGYNFFFLVLSLS